MPTKTQKRGRYGHEGAIDDKPTPKQATVLSRARGVAVVITESDSGKPREYPPRRARPKSLSAHHI